jgi:Holliday junction resolvase-like predicted endonuclease
LPQTLGFRAERRAARHLRWRGWRLCACNWLGGGGELDLVLSRWRTLLVVEVRLRPTLDEALASIDDAKLQRTVLAARALVRQHYLERYRLRFDLMAYDHAGRMRRVRDVLPPLDGASSGDPLSPIHGTGRSAIPCTLPRIGA